MRHVGAFLPATVTTPDWTLVYGTPDEAVELYDRRLDPGQQTNLAGERADVVAELRDRYLQLLASVGTSPDYLLPRTPVPVRS